jgi:hypothetical protein
MTPGESASTIVQPMGGAGVTTLRELGALDGALRLDGAGVGAALTHASPLVTDQKLV